MAEELKNCPFCGGAAKASNNQFAEGKMPWPSALWHVGCDICMVHFRGGSNVDIANVKWNTRAPDPFLTEAVEVLRILAGNKERLVEDCYDKDCFICGFNGKRIDDLINPLLTKLDQAEKATNYE